MNQDEEILNEYELKYPKKYNQRYVNVIFIVGVFMGAMLLLAVLSIAKDIYFLLYSDQNIVITP